MLYRIPRRLVAVAVALAVLAAALVLTVAARTVPAAAAGTSGRVLVVGSTAGCGVDPEEPRHWHVGTDGSVYLLPWCGEPDGANAVHYRDASSRAPLWLRGLRLDQPAAGPSPRPTATTSPTSPTSSSSATAPGERAPVLTANGAATDTTARIRWTDAVPAPGETVETYVVQRRVVGSTWVTAPESPVAGSPLLLAGLPANTQLEVRVRAEYVSGADGPWSGVLSVRTAAASPDREVVEES